jgi:hypothetical protein
MVDARALHGPFASSTFVLLAMPRSTASPVREVFSREALRQRIEGFSARHPVRLGFVVFLLAAAVVLPLSLDAWLGDPEFVTNVLAGAHGMLMDILVFGCLMVWFNQRAERHRRIRRYEDEISDFLGWHDPQATHRIRGSIRRLNRERSVPDNLERAFLAGADLRDADLRGTRLRGAVLREANLRQANLAGTWLGGADFTGADLWNANLRGADFGSFVHLLAPDANPATDLTGANLREADLRELQNVNVETLCQAATLYKARLDPEVERQVEARRPDLLEPRLSLPHPE